MSIEVTQRARDAAASLAENVLQGWSAIGGNDFAAIRNGFWDNDEDDLGQLVQAFAKFEREIAPPADSPRFKTLGMDQTGGRVEVPLAMGPKLSDEAKTRLAELEKLNMEALIVACKFPLGAQFSYHDERGEHDPAYVVQPSGDMLAVNSYADGDQPLPTDVARAAFIVTACNSALAPPADTTMQKRIAEVIQEDGGCWRPCSGCQESVEGYISERDYPYSKLFQCQPGSGCRECGGIGVIWEDGAFLASYGDVLIAPPADAAMVDAVKYLDDLKVSIDRIAEGCYSESLIIHQGEAAALSAILTALAQSGRK